MATTSPVARAISHREEEEEEEERLRSLLLHVHTEAGILERIVYKGKNQHRRCPYFQALLKVRRDVRILKSADLGEILSALFPIIRGEKPVQRAFLPMRVKAKNRGKHNYQDRLLGVARILSQMLEPILKAATQISLLLAKSFFIGFSLTILALLARLRVLIQQILLDVVSVFNKVSYLSQKKSSVKLTQDGIEAFREYYPLVGDAIVLECMWEEDKFVLLEKIQSSNLDNKDVDQGSFPSENTIQYETVDLLNEARCNERELISEGFPENASALDPTIADIVEAHVDSSSAKSATPTAQSAISIISTGSSVEKLKAASTTRISQSATSIVSSDTEKLKAVCSAAQTDSGKKKVAFVSVNQRKLSETSSFGPSKKMKLDVSNSDATKPDDPFLSLLLGGSTIDALF